MFRLTTLGALDLRDPMGRPVREVLSQPKRVALLTFLAIEGKRGPVSRERLLAMFWPESDPERARNALSQSLHHLRRVLGPGVVTSQGSRILTVDPERLWCDAVVFAESLERGEEELALDLYRGDFCGALRVSGARPVEEWTEQQGRRLRSLALAAARTMAERHRAAGDTEAAARAARRLLALRPDDEADARSMELLLAGGSSAATARGDSHPVPPPGGSASPAYQWRYGIAAAAVVGLAIAGWWFLSGHPRRSLDRDLVVVAPFRVSASDSGLSFLGDGAVDLLARRLTGAGRLRTADPRSIFAAWRPDVVAGRRGPGEALALRLGARWLVSGAVLGSSQRMLFAVSLTDVASGDSRDAEAFGPLDSLAVLVDRLALQLLPIISGEPAPRTASLARIPMPALRAYLDGRRAFRDGRFDEAVVHLQEALALDSTFAVAALELAYAAGFSAQGDARYLPHAVALRDRLSQGDQAILTALAGPRYPAPTPVAELLNAWEHAVRAVPQSPAAWYDYGDYLFHAGDALRRDTGFARAEAALRRAAELDSGEVRALVHLTQIALRRGDVAGARRLTALVRARDSTTEQAQFLAWRLAVATGDTATVARIEGGLDTLPLGTVRRLVDWSQADGIRPGLALRAVRVFERRATARADADLALRQEVTADANAGRFDAWARSAQRAAPGIPTGQIAVQAYAFQDGSPPRAATLAKATPAMRAVYETAACGERLGDACERLRALLATLPRGHGSLDTLDGILAAAALRLPGADSLARSIDAMRERAVAFSVLGLQAYVQGRAYAALGDRARALDALRRRPYATMEANNFLAATLRLEGRLATEVGDTAGAIKAYRHYLVLRADPDPDLRPIADSISSELARLERRQ